MKRRQTNEFITYWNFICTCWELHYITSYGLVFFLLNQNQALKLETGTKSLHIYQFVKQLKNGFVQLKINEDNWLTRTAIQKQNGSFKMRTCISMIILSDLTVKCIHTEKCLAFFFSFHVRELLFFVVNSNDFYRKKVGR